MLLDGKEKSPTHNKCHKAELSKSMADYIVSSDGRLYEVESVKTAVELVE